MSKQNVRIPAAFPAFTLLFLAFSPAFGQNPPTVPSEKGLVDTFTNLKINDRYIPYALTLSGGISLGAYEAGVNWAVLRYLRISADRNIKSETAVMPKLAAVTGASAGAINALISALAWCIAPEKVELYDGVSNNLFFKTWVPVGLDKLLPGTEEKYAVREGVLTLGAFKDALRKITELIGIEKAQIERYALPIPDVEEKGKPIFRKDCEEIPFGFTVTSEEPYQQQVSGLSVKNQRHFIPLRLKVQGDRIAFYNESVDPTAPGVGNVIYLRRAHPTEDPTSNDYEVDKGAVLNAVLASSAFPVAFGRRTLEFCRPGRRVQNNDPSCGKEARPESGAFVDGGVFDNVPLGATRVLAEGGDVEPARRVTYVYIDPDQRRNQEQIVTAEGTEVREDQAKNQKGRPKDAVMGFGLSSQLRFGRGSVDSARNYELHKELATGDWTAAVSVKLEEVVGELQRRRSLPNTDGKAKPPTLMCEVGEKPVNDECKSLFEATKKTLALGNSEASRFFSMPAGAKRLRSAESCVTESALKFMYRLQFCQIKDRKWENERTKILDQMDSLVALLRRSDKTISIRLKVLENGIKRARADPLGDRQVFVSSRFHPIVGEYLFGFGAFFDRSFREFDYYVGVYDAVHSIAAKICELRQTTATPDCRVSDEIGTVYKLLGVGNDKAKAGAYIFSMMLKREHPGDDYKEIYSGAITDKSFEAITQSLLTDNCSGDKRNECLLWNKTFESFIGALNARKYDLSDEQRKTLEAFVDPSGEVREDWWLDPLSKVTRRLQNLEYTEPNKKGFAKQIGWMVALVDAKAKEGSLMQMGVRNESKFAGEGWVSQTVWPSELGYLGGSHGVPYVAWHWVPYFLSVQLPLPFEMHVKQYCGDACRAGEPWITQAGARIQGSVKGIKLGFGMPEFNYLSRQNPNNGRRTGWGWSGFIGWKCLRATFGERSINGDLVTKPKDYYLDLGVRVEIFSSKKCP